LRQFGQEQTTKKHGAYRARTRSKPLGLRLPWPPGEQPAFNVRDEKIGPKRKHSEDGNSRKYSVDIKHAFGLEDQIA
jgi:hypothetical protein